MKKKSFSDKLLQITTISLCLIYLISAVFDLSVSLTVFYLAPDTFLNYESNEIFRETLAKGQYFFQSWVVLLDFSIPLIYLSLYKLFITQKNFNTLFTFFVFTPMMIYFSFKHFKGGYSWLS